MADEADKADIIINESLELAIKQNQDKLKPNNLTHCCDCGIEIPKARKLAMPSAKRCVECQGYIK